MIKSKAKIQGYKLFFGLSLCIINFVPFYTFADGDWYSYLNKEKKSTRTSFANTNGIGSVAVSDITLGMFVERESFEKGLGGWEPDHYIQCEEEFPPCKFKWSIMRFQEKAYNGSYSLKCFLDGRNDDGTIWMEKNFPVPANSKVKVGVSFYILNNTNAPINAWPVVAYIGIDNPEKETDFTIIGNTQEIEGWRQYIYSREFIVGKDSKIWIAFGFGATSEFERNYFMDFVEVMIQ